MSGYGVTKAYGANHSQALSMARSGARSGAISGAFTFGVKQGIPKGNQRWSANKMMFRATMGGLKAGAMGQNVEQGMVMGALSSWGDRSSKTDSNSFFGGIKEDINDYYKDSSFKQHIADPFMNNIGNYIGEYYDNNELAIDAAHDFYKISYR